MTHPIIQRLVAAYREPGAEADLQRQRGARIARVLGTDAPRELLIAAGFVPIRLVERTGRPTPMADALMGAAELAPRSRSLLEAILEVPAEDTIVISNAEAQFPQIFAILREVAAMKEVHLGQVHFIDLKHLPRASTHRYNHARLCELRDSIAPGLTDEALSRAMDAIDEQCSLIERVMALRSQQARLSGQQALAVIGSAAILPTDEHIGLLGQLLGQSAQLPVLSGARMFLTGSNHESGEHYADIESQTGTIVGEDHDWGDRWCAPRPPRTADPMHDLADPSLRVPLVGQSGALRAQWLAAGIERTKPDVVQHVCLPGDEAAQWNLNVSRRVCRDAGIRLVVSVNEQPVAPAMLPAASSSLPRGNDRAVVTRPAVGERSRKSLRSVAAFGEYQRHWFADLRRRVAAGEPLAVVNANAPQEILRALDIPFVVNQWWASIVAAKQQSSRYLDLLRQHGYPTQFDSYSSQGLAAAFDDDTANAPWGGLPRPTFLHALNGTDGAARLFESWAEETGADLFLFERTVDTRWRLFSEWWDSLPDRWDEVLEAQRIDLMTVELRQLIEQLERRTKRTFSQERFAQVMDLVNRQEEYYRRTRDLIARTTPAPAGVVDTMPATMTPQWHRGTQWACDAARAFYEEVAQRVERGEAACADERVRLMWVGRGMWSEMGFYQRWEASHGAVFVWSMYLALAADGYIRTFDRGRDPLRALAARVVTMGDELRMPTWAAAWHVNEARTHSVDGAVALSDADPFVLRALERAGIPVLALPLDNFNKESADRVAIERSVTQFIEGPVSVLATRRRVGQGS